MGTAAPVCFIVKIGNYKSGGLSAEVGYARESGMGFPSKRANGASAGYGVSQAEGCLRSIYRGGRSIVVYSVGRRGRGIGVSRAERSSIHSSRVPMTDGGPQIAVSASTRDKYPGQVLGTARCLGFQQSNTVLLPRRLYRGASTAASNGVLLAAWLGPEAPHCSAGHCSAGHDCLLR